MELSKTDKQVLAGMFLSKFDEEALKYFGFKTFKQAFNILGYSLGGSPASIKNYRDEFDPYFPNPRKGWYFRDMKAYCKPLFDTFKDVDFLSMARLVESFLNPDFEVEQEIDKISKKAKAYNPVQRIATGLAAEEYFMTNYHNYFADFQLKDTRHLACGFDFKLDFENDFYCVEVKGLNERSGNFLMTQKEFDVATELENHYCLYVVSNFKDIPIDRLIYNPVRNFTLEKIQSTVITVNYKGVI